MLAIFTILSVIIGSFAYLQWKKGTPYGSPDLSPNRRYYSQKYRTISLNSFFPAMPGQGSDNDEGYIRIYAADGTLIGERFIAFFRDVKTIWAGDKVYFTGGDAEFVNLPDNSE